MCTARSASGSRDRFGEAIASLATFQGRTNDTSIVIADDCDGTNGTYEDNDALAGGVDDDTVGPNGNFNATGNGTVNTEVPTLTNGTVTATIFRVTVN